jgi:hypothetical protein
MAVIERIGIAFLWFFEGLFACTCAFIAVTAYRWMRYRWGQFSEAAAEGRREYVREQAARLYSEQARRVMARRAERTR